MPELAENENIDDPNIDDPNIVDDPKDDIIPEAEERALKGGWKPRDEWDGDSDDWSSAKTFNQTKDMIEANKNLRANQDRMQHDFDNRIDNLQRLNDQNLDYQLKSLKTKRDNAASEADMDTYNETNQQIDELQKTDIQPAQQPVNRQAFMTNVVNHPTTQAFMNENPWIKDNNSAKGVYGQKIFNDWLIANENTPSATLEDGLNLVKESVNREFPQTNPNRDTRQSMGDRNTGSRRTAPRNRLTMDELTREEKNIFDSMGNTWKSEEDFLHAVALSRKGE